MARDIDLALFCAIGEPSQSIKKFYQNVTSSNLAYYPQY
jgi:hypothetical protein